jgi:hypothetical protein
MNENIRVKITGKNHEAKKKVLRFIWDSLHKANYEVRPLAYNNNDWPGTGYFIDFKVKEPFSPSPD